MGVIFFVHRKKKNRGLTGKSPYGFKDIVSCKKLSTDEDDEFNPTERCKENPKSHQNTEGSTSWETNHSKKGEKTLKLKRPCIRIHVQMCMFLSNIPLKEVTPRINMQTIVWKKTVTWKKKKD